MFVMDQAPVYVYVFLVLLALTQLHQAVVSVHAFSPPITSRLLRGTSWPSSSSRSFSTSSSIPSAAAVGFLNHTNLLGGAPYSVNTGEPEPLLWAHDGYRLLLLSSMDGSVRSSLTVVNASDPSSAVRVQDVLSDEHFVYLLLQRVSNYSVLILDVSKPGHAPVRVVEHSLVGSDSTSGTTATLDSRRGQLYYTVLSDEVPATSRLFRLNLTSGVSMRTELGYAFVEPHCVQVDSASGRVYVLDGFMQATLVVLDVASGDVLETLPLGSSVLRLGAVAMLLMPPLLHVVAFDQVLTSRLVVLNVSSSVLRPVLQIPLLNQTRVTAILPHPVLAGAVTLVDTVSDCLLHVDVQSGKVQRVASGGRETWAQPGPLLIDPQRPDVLLGVNRGFNVKAVQLSQGQLVGLYGTADELTPFELTDLGVSIAVDMDLHRRVYVGDQLGNSVVQLSLDGTLQYRWNLNRSLVFQLYDLAVDRAHEQLLIALERTYTGVGELWLFNLTQPLSQDVARIVSLPLGLIPTHMHWVPTGGSSSSSSSSSTAFVSVYSTTTGGFSVVKVDVANGQLDPAFTFSYQDSIGGLTALSDGSAVLVGLSSSCVVVQLNATDASQQAQWKVPSCSDTTYGITGLAVMDEHDRRTLFVSVREHDTVVQMDITTAAQEKRRRDEADAERMEAQVA